VRRGLLWVLGAAVVGVGGAGSYLLAVFPQVVPANTAVIEATPERLARGTYLAQHVLACTECHADRDWTRYGAPALPPAGAGRSACLAADAPMAGMDATFPGRLCFPNVTPDRATGVGDWTDGELLRAIRDGVDRDDHALFPIMPYVVFRALADEDARSIVVWLRSLEPVSRPQAAKSIDFPVNLFIRLVPRPTVAPILLPDVNDRVARGRYLATIGRCGFCHSPREGQSPTPIAGREYSGGNEFRGPFGLRRSTNLTPHPGGLGNVSREDFIALFRRNGARGAVLPRDNTIMAWPAYAGMTDEDLGLIHDFLRTLPPVATTSL
jgi:hypothetical protein